MAVFPRPSSPRVVWHDLRTFLGRRERHQWLFAFLSILMPALIVLGLYLDSRTDPRPAQIIYVQSWPENRSDAEIIALQKIDQKKREAQFAERRRQYRRLADQLGIDY